MHYITKLSAQRKLLVKLIINLAALIQGSFPLKKNVKKADIVRFWRHPSPSSRGRGEDEDGHHDCNFKKK